MYWNGKMFTRAAIRNQPRSLSRQRLRHKPSQLRWSQDVRIVCDLCVKKMVSPWVSRVRSWFVTRNKLDAHRRIRNPVVSFCRNSCSRLHSLVPHSNPCKCTCVSVCVFRNVNLMSYNSNVHERQTLLSITFLFKFILCHDGGNEHSSGRREFSTHWNTPPTPCGRLHWSFPVTLSLKNKMLYYYYSLPVACCAENRFLRWSSTLEIGFERTLESLSWWIGVHPSYLVSQFIGVFLSVSRAYSPTTTAPYLGDQYVVRFGVSIKVNLSQQSRGIPPHGEGISNNIENVYHNNGRNGK